MKRKLIMIVIGLVVGNFLYQVLSGNLDWMQAFDRSSFQIITVVVIYYSLLREKG